MRELRQDQQGARRPGALYELLQEPEARAAGEGEGVMMPRQTHQESRETALRRYEARIDGWRPKTSATSRNARRHWADVRQSDSVARWQVLAALKDTDWPWRLRAGGAGWRVTITVYVGRGPLPDSDNLVTACKAFRDALAARLGVDDGPAGPEWVVRAERGTDAVGLVLEEINDESS